MQSKVNEMNKKKFLLGSFVLIILLMAGCYSSLPVYGLANVEEIDVMVLESFPVQVHLIVNGYLPNPCTEIYQIIQERTGNHFSISISTFRSPGICIQIIVPFEEVIPLEVYGLPAGTYTVEVNGVQGTFIMEVDNIL